MTGRHEVRNLEEMGKGDGGEGTVGGNGEGCPAGQINQTWQNVIRDPTCTLYIVQ